MASIDLTVKVCFHGSMRSFGKGQIGLMLLIVMGLVISIVLSIAARSLSDISLSRQEKENSSAFAIAESGVEQALRSLSQGTVVGGDVHDTTNLFQGNYSVNEMKSFDMYVKEGEAAQIDLTGATGSTVVSWVKGGEDPGTCSEGSGMAPAAIEVTLIDASNVITRAYYNANSCALGSNGFASSSAGSDGFGSSQSIVVGSNVAMRIKPIYNGTTVKVTGNNLASQLYLIQSQASGGDARTDIEAKRGLDAAGSVFDYALFSNTTIIK